jgi:hypothetical protein
MKRNVIISGEFTINELTAPKPTNASKPKTAVDRIAALKAAGIDTSCFFPMGSDMVVKVVDGVPVQVLDDAPIYQSIASGGYVNVHPLFRRFVMAQMFRLLRRMERSGESFNALVQHNGYEYQWRMLENELHAIAKMQENNDAACFSQRILWFNQDVVSAMIDDYLFKLRSHVDKLSHRRNKRGEMVYKHTCKGMPYVKIAGKSVFLNDIGRKLYTPVVKASLAVKQAKSYRELYQLVVSFNKQRPHLKWRTKQADAFINAYKGAGAYFTMRNLVMFHGARFASMGEKASLRHVEDKAREYEKEGWRMMGVMKQLIADAGISIEGKVHEWKVQKQQK